MKRVYVAGAYSAPDVITVFDNMRRGISFCAKLVTEGYAPFCPWLDYQFALNRPVTLEQYRAYSMAWLEVSDEVWVLPHWEQSAGTIAEIKRATELGIPVRFLTESDVNEG